MLLLQNMMHTQEASEEVPSHGTCPVFMCSSMTEGTLAVADLENPVVLKVNAHTSFSKEK